MDRPYNQYFESGRFVWNKHTAHEGRIEARWSGRKTAKPKRFYFRLEVRKRTYQRVESESYFPFFTGVENPGVNE